jgi:hypothetical protein
MRKWGGVRRRRRRRGCGFLGMGVKRDGRTECA